MSNSRRKRTNTSVPAPNPSIDPGSPQSEPRSKEFGCLMRSLPILPGMPSPIPGSSKRSQGKTPRNSDHSPKPS